MSTTSEISTTSTTSSIYNGPTTRSSRRVIKCKLYEKLWEISYDADDFQVNCKEYNNLMDHSVEEIKEYLKQHGKQYWNGSTKRYQVLYLMKLNKEKKADEIAICSSD